MKCQKCNRNEIEHDSAKSWCLECRKAARMIAIQWKQEHSKKLWSGRDYASRDFILRQIGFSSYREYLKSELWRNIREKVFQLKGRLCFLCGNLANQVHHNRYHRNDLLGKTLAYLFPICDKCHEGIEFSKRKKKKMPLHHARHAFSVAAASACP